MSEVARGQGINVYHKNGLLHREDGPAIERFFGDLLEEEEYYFEGKLHRIGGPAWRRKNKVEFYIHGNKVYTGYDEPYLMSLSKATDRNKKFVNIVRKIIRQYKENEGQNLVRYQHRIDKIAKIFNGLIDQKLIDNAIASLILV